MQKKIRRIFCTFRQSKTSSYKILIKIKINIIIISCFANYVINKPMSILNVIGLCYTPLFELFGCADWVCL